MKSSEGNSNEDRKRALEIMDEELQKIIDSVSPDLRRNYLKVRRSFVSGYAVPELDPLRYEVCLCITFGFNQAAITLTNHMLERLLKTTLMHHHVLKSEIRKEQREPPTAEAMIEYQAEGKQRYLANNLEKNINAACTEGLISKKEKQELHELRERFRNAFGHADPDKTFGKSEVPVQAVRLGESAGGIEVGPEESVRVADFLLAMGPLQVKLAEDFAPGYFRYVDDLARRIFEKVYPKTMGGEEGSVEDAPDPHHVS